MKRFLYIILLVVLSFSGCTSDSSNPTEPDDPSPYTTRMAVVTYVYDGDTIQVDGSERVRYIGIDTPEREECYYSEATQRNRELVSNKTVLLEICKASPVDQYDRTLAHITVNGSLVNAILIQEGYARAYRVPPCTSRADYYATLEREARDAGRGMWTACY
ncbi:thermonuclease family protein [bacterium]|nr:thermonuclease family protein [candidate division CSSED10-310 bacterium]